MRVFSQIILLLWFILSPNLMAETKLEFRDGTPEWHKYIREKAQQLNDTNLADSLKQELINRGFLNSKVKEVAVDTSYKLVITFGEEFYIGTIFIEGEITDTIEYNKLFTPGDFKFLTDSILQNFQSRGYYFANLTILKYLSSNNRLDVYLNFQKGPIVTVSSIDFAGIIKTDKKLLEKYITIKPGDTLEDSRVDLAAKNLEKLDFVSIKKPPERVIFQRTSSGY